MKILNNSRDILNSVRQMRSAYADVCRSLPWLDMSFWEDDKPAFKEFAHDIDLPAVKSRIFTRDMYGSLARFRKDENLRLLRYSPSYGDLEDISIFFHEMEEQKIPLVVLHTDVDIAHLKMIADKHPSMIFIIESGPSKILYFIENIERLMLECRNIFLCTFNLCNWLGLERLCKKGLADRLLFGTHRPRYNPHAVMGPIAMGHMTWQEKCNIAGNNLRRLLNISVSMPSEPVCRMPLPFIIDSHGHNGPAERFPVADNEFGHEGWREFMDSCAIERIFLCPSASLKNRDSDAEALTGKLRKFLPGRIFFFVPFCPDGEGETNRIDKYIKHPDCVGIKIHPSFHGISAEDSRYDTAFELAERHNVPILTHSWEVSTSNPVQHLSHPERFVIHLRNHPEAMLILGHAGGRPSTMESVINLCREFKRVIVDVSGDYYDNGLIEKLVSGVGVEKILFGSDVNWIDPRANLATVLAADISDEDALRILRTNALEIQRIKNKAIC